MDKLVGIAVLVLVVVSVWAVMPSKPAAPNVSGNQQGQNTANAKGKQSADGSARSPNAARMIENREMATNNQTDDRPVSNTVSKKLDLKGNPNAGEETANAINPQLIPKAINSFNRQKQNDIEPEPQKESPFSNVHWDGEMDYDDLEDALMKHYAKRTPNGGLPKNLSAVEVLPESVLSALNVPKTAKLRMIGDFEPDDPRSVTDTLKRARKGEHETGFTFDDGSYSGRRVYIKMVDD